MPQGETSTLSRPVSRQTSFCIPDHLVRSVMLVSPPHQVSNGSFSEMTKRGAARGKPTCRSGPAPGGSTCGSKPLAWRWGLVAFMAAAVAVVDVDLPGRTRAFGYTAPVPW